MGDIGSVPKRMRPRSSSAPSVADAPCACPACPDSALVDFTTPDQVCIELCRGCKGMLVTPDALGQLLGGGQLASLAAEVTDPGRLGPCSRCNFFHWTWRALTESAGVGTCRACGTHWLEAGTLERLRTERIESRRRARLEAGEGPASMRMRARPASRAPEMALSPEMPPEISLAHQAFTAAAPTAPLPVIGLPPSIEIFMATAPEAAGAPPVLAPRPQLEPFDRVSFDAGVSNRIGVPLALVLALGFCSTATGQFFGGLVSMPFHELGHALTSWLSSRIAVPLPFFTVWHEEQSVVFGVVVAMLIGGFAVDAWQERRRFGVGVAIALLLIQGGLSTLAPARVTLMLQILGGGLGELVLGALVLVAFHFPLPDRLRWDFWRWLAIVPGAICLVHALLLWSRAVHDASAMPWGSAIGDDSDGDINRLVYVFGWRARELASFYLKIGWASMLAVVASYAGAWWRALSTTNDREA